MSASKTSTPGFVIHVVVILCYGCSLVSGGDNLYTKRHVDVVNDLYSGVPLKVHCKSAENDLGLKEVPFNQSISWSFKTNLWRTTLYWCTISWQDVSYHVYSKSFEAYNARKSEISGCKDCVWGAKGDGIYYTQGLGPIDKFMYGWESS